MDVNRNNEGVPAEVLERDASVLAKGTAAYYHALREAGISTDTAIQFTIAWIGSVGNSGDDE